MSNSGKYTLVINGYDWGPAVDKIIVFSEKSVDQKKIKAEDFTVHTETQDYNWTSFPPVLGLINGSRTVTAAYLCDENGQKSRAEEGSLIALEISVHPEDPFCNPFLYGSDMMNHWKKIYNYTVENKKLNILSDKEEKRLSPLADQFKMGTSTTGKITLSYGAWEPANHGDKTPLIIWLHGMGEGGKDPYITLLGNKVVNLITPAVQDNFENGAYVLAPQADGFWMQTKFGNKDFSTWVGDENPVSLSCYTEALFNLIDTFVKENPSIDTNRIYIGGCSNGGYMTMNMMIEYPEYFAAGYPVCQAYPDSKIDENKLSVLAKQHIWLTQSKDDKTVNPDLYSVPTFKRLLEAGAKDVHFTFWEHVDDQTGNFKDKAGKPYRYNGHFSWVYTLNNECEESGKSIFKWLSMQSK